MDVKIPLIFPEVLQKQAENLGWKLQPGVMMENNYPTVEDLQLSHRDHAMKRPR